MVHASGSVGLRNIPKVSAITPLLKKDDARTVGSTGSCGLRNRPPTKTSQERRSIESGDGSRSIEGQPWLKVPVSEEVATQKEDSLAAKGAQLDKEPKRPKTQAKTFPLKAQYTTHHARSDVGKKITWLIDKDRRRGILRIHDRLDGRR